MAPTKSVWHLFLPHRLPNIIGLKSCQGDVDFMRAEWILSAMWVIGVLALLVMMVTSVRSSMGSQ